MLRFIIHAVAIPLYTLVLGSAAIVTLIVAPRVDPIRLFARPWARLIAITCGIRVMVAGLEHIPESGACVYMSNHQSHFDVVALLLALPHRFAILAKRELFYIPIFGWAVWLAGMIPIDRSNRVSAIKSLDRAAMKIRAGCTVLVFAEGTRSEDGILKPFKKGGFHMALKSGAPILPITVSGSRQVLPKNSLRIQPGTITVKIGSPIHTTGRDNAEIEVLMEEVRETMAANLQASTEETH